MSSSIFSSKALPLGFLCGLLVVLMFEVAVLYVSPNIASRHQILKQAKLEDSANPANSYELLVLGDSSVFWGVIPNQLSADTGFSTFNLGFHGTDSIFMPYCALRGYLESAAKKPKKIILGFLHAAFTTEGIQDLARYDFDRRCFALFMTEHGPIDAALSFSPTMRHRHFFRMLFVNRRWNWRSTESAEKLISDLRQAHGFYSPYPNQVWDRKRMPLSRKRYPDFSKAAFSMKYFEKILELAKTHNLELSVILPYGPGAKITEYISFLKDLKNVYPNISFIDPAEELRDDSLYFDGWHLNFRGAEELTTVIANALR